MVMCEENCGVITKKIIVLNWNCSVFFSRNSIFSGLHCRLVNNNDDQTILIDFEKFQKFNHTNVGSSNKTNVELCTNSENKEYRKCGNKCVLSCRYALSTSNFSISTENCNETKCIEGCFCKNGFVRHHNKCILSKECPIRSSRALKASDDRSGTFLKHLGLLNQGCGLKGCPIEIHNHGNVDVV